MVFFFFFHWTHWSGKIHFVVWREPRHWVDSEIYKESKGSCSVCTHTLRDNRYGKRQQKRARASHKDQAKWSTRETCLLLARPSQVLDPHWEHVVHFSKIQLGKDDKKDHVMQEIKRLLSYVREGGWAMVSKGSSVMVNEKGTTMLNALLEYNTWKENVDMQGFDEAFPKLVTKLRGKSHPCFCFEFLHFSGRIPDTMTCAECPRSVDKYSTFLSCQSTQGINSKHHAINKTTS